ncbi:hypothetical protein [Flavobacterium koreense]
MGSLLFYKKRREEIREKLISLESIIEKVNTLQDISKDSMYLEFIKLKDFNSKIDEIFLPSLYNSNQKELTLLSKFNLDYSFKTRKSHINKKLEELNIEELINLINNYSLSYSDYKRVRYLIHIKSFSKWLTNLSKKLNRVLKQTLNCHLSILENKRENFRKIYSFNFKNLDDTHATIIFN